MKPIELVSRYVAKLASPLALISPPAAIQFLRISIRLSPIAFQYDKPVFAFSASFSVLSITVENSGPFKLVRSGFSVFALRSFAVVFMLTTFVLVFVAVFEVFFVAVFVAVFAIVLVSDKLRLSD